MAYYEFIWTDEIIEHIAEHGISQDDFESVACDPVRTGKSKSSGRLASWG